MINEENKYHPILSLLSLYIILLLSPFLGSYIDIVFCMRNYVYFFHINSLVMSSNYLFSIFISATEIIIIRGVGLCTSIFISATEINIIRGVGLCTEWRSMFLTDWKLALDEEYND